MTGSGRYLAVVLGASLGGTEALHILLSGLRAPLPVPVLVAIHLGPAVSKLDQVLSRASSVPVRWLTDGIVPQPGTVYLCPGRTFVRFEPDGTCTVRRRTDITSMGMVDHLFESAAGALGDRLLALVLTGAGRDGAAGARAVKEAGGTVLVQDETTSAAFGMPGAVVEGGDADLVLPLGELAEVLDQVVGAGRPLPTPARRAADAAFAAGGEMGRLMAATDWGATPLGPVETWSPTLRSVLSAILSHPLPMTLLWGPQWLQLYNDACVDLMGGYHPQALGRPAAQTWSEVVTEIDRLRNTGRTGGEQLGAGKLRANEPSAGLLFRDRPFVLRRAGRPEEAFFTFCYSPVRDAGQVVAALGTAVETTAQVVADRRLAALHRLTTVEITESSTDAQICADVIAVLADQPNDVPFALLYLVDGAGSAYLSAATGLTEPSPALIRSVALAQSSRWPLHATMSRGEAQVVDDLQERFPGLAAGPGPEPPGTALILPVGAIRTGTDGPAAVLVAGVSSHAVLDTDYRRFLDLVAEHAGAALTRARRGRDAQERIAVLAELNHVKTEFFANVSHEFRTPLTLLLLPIEQMIERLGDGPDAPSPHARNAEDLRQVHRNALRLLRLVDGLFSFAELEHGRTRPAVETIEDLAGVTAELAGMFRATVERAGLELDVDCPPLGRPVRLDPGMWETVVLNLLSNAFKHTFTGGITVRLTLRAHHIELDVSDTGVGIPEADIAHLFTRFHRVKDAKARSREGSGIGLALVQQLVRQHRGNIRVRSNPGQGSTFTVWVPLVARTPGKRNGPEPADAARRRRVFVDEAEHWLAGDRLPSAVAAAPEPGAAPPGDRLAILVADDNADMRRYLRRLLGDRYAVHTAADGVSALRALSAHRIDLVLSDVMMPEQDGLELLRHIRTDPRLRATPVILLTAVAGAESTMRALAAGAHDYIVKPFTARELLARIESQLALARLRPHVRPPND
jgi:signal transduction histidine kinase/chemotaxis response regulator CheB